MYGAPPIPRRHNPGTFALNMDLIAFLVVMVDTDDTRRTMDDRRRTTPGVWHKLPTGELKMEIPGGSPFVALGALNALVWFCTYI